GRPRDRAGGSAETGRPKNRKRLSTPTGPRTTLEPDRRSFDPDRPSMMGRGTGTLGRPRRKQRWIHRFQNAEFDDFQPPVEPIALHVDLRGRLHASKVLVVAVSHLLGNVEIHGWIVDEQRLSYRLER